ncbi:MAG: 16S rRNA (cytidine(1402)-2'-O)-methyltransferase [Candidatus Moranbacteria bacterium]|nr:16S rRNA (cytidine(1402)-2'-O)-methyltransferase [Candidatus Moranbacteria bacterium]
MGTLYLVATPIGNMEDITLRALRTLKECDAVLAEDTRVTRRLLDRYEIDRPAISCHEHTDDAKLASLVARLSAGESFAYVTDAGTPGLSDPGNKLVSLTLAAGVAVVPVPGPSALGAIISVAGIDMREFIFKGFPPHKKGRETFFRYVAESELPVVYYESPHRVIKNLGLLATLAPEKRIILGRELTKMFEETVRGTAAEVGARFESEPSKVKGEFVIVAYTGDIVKEL